MQSWKGRRVVHACDNHEPSNPKQGKGTIVGVPEGTYGPWIVVVRKKNGTKIRRGSGLELGKTQGHHLKVRDVSVNEIRLGVDVDKTTFSSGSPREGKRKMSPIKAPTGLQLLEALQNISKDIPPLDLSHIGLGLKAKALTRSGNNHGSLKPNASPSIKGKKVISCSRTN